MHRILGRQIDKHLGKNKDKITPEIAALLEAISDTYSHFDEDRALLDRSLSLSSDEFLQNSRKLMEAKAEVEEIVKQRTKELRNEQARLLASIESLSLGFLMLDAEGHIFHLNTTFSSILELDKANDNLVLEGQIQERLDLKNLFQEATKNSKGLNKSIAFRKKYIHVFVTPIISQNSEIIGAVVLIEDTTKEKQIDKAKSEFVILASHQLRTPLTIVKWHVESLASKVKKSPDAERLLKSLTFIEGGTKRMVSLVKALLNVSRIEVGQLAIKPVSLDLKEICKNELNELQIEINERKMQISEKYQADLPYILADPHLIEMIFQNLLTNSLKYTHPGGKILISIETKLGSDLPLNHKPNEEYALISVSDTGYGIPSEEQSKIFTKLYRAENVKLLKENGTGLGLYITKSVTEASGGKIWFKSPITEDPTKPGTSFYVTLPLKGVPPGEGSVLEDEADILTIS